ncbi:MAG: DUF4186 domain-containing protein [Spirochaetia bacterium]|nr:DUF4186 domain-containing protein [Spirochaetia bacterium]
MFTDLNQLFIRLDNSKFRSSFHLRRRELAYFQEKGMETIMHHAEELLATRLFPEYIPNDGKQTPMKNHPVFIAQHATGCCCRGCLEKWHGIPKGKALTEEEQKYVLAVIRAWLFRETSSSEN